MSAEKLRWGVLGPGSIAHKLADGVVASETAELVAAGSRDVARAQAFAEKYGPGVRAHGSYEDLLADTEVDVVYIATPHPFHAEWAIKAARAGKHILCEKPVGLNYPEAEAMIDAAREHGVFFMEAFMYRCYPQTARVVELLRDGTLGAVKFISAHFCFDQGYNPQGRHQDRALGGGGILDIGCYPMSFARLIAGAAQGKPFANPVEVKGTGHIGETGVDEWAACSLLFEDGIVAEASCAIRLSRDNHATIYGENGRIVIPNPWFGEGRFLLYKDDAAEPEEITVPLDKARYRHEVDAVACFLDNREAASPAMSWEDTLGNMAALDKWRLGFGMTYEREVFGPGVPVLGGGRLARRPESGHNMTYDTIPGVPQPVSRLVMGAMGGGIFAGPSFLWDAFFERGGNAWDTAALYGGGQSERNLGQWIANRGVRKETVIVTKGAHTPKNWPEFMPDEFAGSLERLQTDYVDVYMMHRDNPDVPVGEFIDIMAGWQNEGRVRAYGFSNWTLERMKEAIDYARKSGLPLPSVVSNNLSLARMVDPVWPGVLSAKESAYHQFLMASGLRLLPWSSQARGFFTDRSGPDKKDDPELVRCWYSDDNFERKRRAQELAEKYGVTALNIALAWVLTQPYPTFPLIGPANIRELRTALPGLDLALSADEVAWLDLRD